MATINPNSGSQIEIDDRLYEFVDNELLSGTDRTADQVFTILGEIVEKFGKNNTALLDKRADLQEKIDTYYKVKRDSGWTPNAETANQDAIDFESFLLSIGYIAPERPLDFHMTTPTLDSEMDQNGPELVTPVTNASMVVGGANARWGSLYDAYFLSDIHPELDQENNRPARLAMVVDSINSYMDEYIVSWENNIKFGDISSYQVNSNDAGQWELKGITRDGTYVNLGDPSKFIGFNLDDNGDLSDFLLEDNGLRLQVLLYEGGKVSEENGQFKDLLVESALTNIIDFEDAVSVVDADDLVIGLQNYLGVIRGSLQAFGSRGNLKQINSDKTYTNKNGNQDSLKSTCLMSVRNVSIHMYTDIVKVGGKPIPERMLGLLLTTLIGSIHDNGSHGQERDGKLGEGYMPIRKPNSSKRYIYQVTPKLQTPEEVGEQIRIFEFLEDKLSIPKGTILIGIMNEELGMTLQLSEALRIANGRVFFINTGFLDRTGSQIRVQMQAGPVNLRDNLTQATYNTSYELHNVDVGVQTGVHINGKIGKGMQVRNRSMAEMMEKKIDHPRTGGNTAWVPAPFPSDLHSMHYHMVNVDEIQKAMEDAEPLSVNRHSLLTFPLMDPSSTPSGDELENLLMRYIHSMIAYAEPWVTRGIGCSGVLNFDQVEEMKDRATERIDSAILANWRLHNVISQDDIERAIEKVCKIVDDQNLQTDGYIPMSASSENRQALIQNPVVASVLEVINDALTTPSAYVEPGLFRNRKLVKLAN